MYKYGYMYVLDFKGYNSLTFVFVKMSIIFSIVSAQCSLDIARRLRSLL